MSIRSELRKLRFMQVGLIAAIPMFWYVALNIPQESVTPINKWQVLVVGFALWAVLGGWRLRTKLLSRAMTALQQKPTSTKALREWRAAQLIAMATAESVALWGVFIRLGLNGSLRTMLLFSGFAILLLLIWTPRMPEMLRK